MKEWSEMKYENFAGPADELIRMKLREIEDREHVRVFHAVESGSRAWGFASPDSDYDVRFIYVRDRAFYLSLGETKDFINWELNETLDINGWDIKKALQHFHKSNSTLYEWSNSPVVYETTDEWKALYEKVGSRYFSCTSAIHQYEGTARKNYLEYLSGDMVRYKKYFYSLRTLLSCKWIEERKCPPPVLFDDLYNEVLEDDMKDIVADLLAKKVRMSESDKAPAIGVINHYIEDKLAYYKELLTGMEDDRNKDWSILEEEFRAIIGLE